MNPRSITLEGAAFRRPVDDTDKRGVCHAGRQGVHLAAAEPCPRKQTAQLDGGMSGFLDGRLQIFKC